MISPYVPAVLSMIGAINAILSIALGWVTIKGLESLLEGPINLVSEPGSILFGASATVAFLGAAAVFHVGATGMGFVHAKSPESGKFWAVAYVEVVAAVCLVIAGIVWCANLEDNIEAVLFILGLLKDDGAITQIPKFFLFSAGQGFGITSFLFSVAAAITAFKVHNENKYGSMQVQAWGPATGAKQSWGGPVVVVQQPYGQPYGQSQQPPQQMQQMQQVQMQQMPQTQQVQMQMQQMPQTQQVQQPWGNTQRV